MSKGIGGKIFAIDFDGTCVEHEYPRVGNNVPHAVRVLTRIHESGAKLILWTMRSDSTLQDAQKWFSDNGIPLFGVNRNPAQGAWTSSPKAYAHVYIDDAALGCPLIEGVHIRPIVDWLAVERIIFDD